MKFFILIEKITPNSSNDLFFSLGDALTALGLLFTVFQLKNKTWDIVLEIRHPFKRSLFLIFCLIGLLITPISLYYKDEISQGFIMWMGIVAFASFIAASYCLYHFGSKQSGLFTKSRAKKFFEILCKKIVDSNDNFETCVDIIEANLTEIILALKEQETDPKSEYASCAKAVIRFIICDSRVVKYIVQYRLTFIESLLSELKKNNINDKYIASDIQPIFNNLFYQKNSYLYKQYNREGVFIVYNLYNKFQDPYFSGVLKALSAHEFKQNYPTDLDVFLFALENSLKGYWKTLPQSQVREEIVRSLYSIEKIIGTASHSIILNKNSEQGWSNLVKIAGFLGTTYFDCYQEALNFGKPLINEEPINTRFVPEVMNINSAFVKCLYCYIKNLAQISYKLCKKNKDINEKIRIKCLDIFSTIMMNSNLKEFRSALIEKIWKDINSNIKGELNPPAPILRIYLDVMILKINNDRDIYLEERKKLIKLLYSDLKPKIENNDLMINRKGTLEEALLPKSIKYNRTTKQFEYFLPDNTKQIIHENDQEEINAS